MQTLKEYLLSNPKAMEKFKYHLKSSAFTFLTGFLPSLALLFKETNFDTLEAAGWIGATLAILRLVLKAAWSGVVILVTWMAAKVKKG